MQLTNFDFAYFRFEINKHITINYHHHFIKEKNDFKV